MGKVKNNLFNKNSTPFWLLAVIHFSMLLKLVIHSKQKNTWILLLSNIGFAYLFEYPTLNLFHGYRYKPSIMKKRVFDSILGGIFSQALFVPISATFLTIFNKSWKWKMNFSLFYYCVETLFLRLNIYKVHWWRPIYTFVLLHVYFFISDGFYKALSAQKRWAMVIAHFLAIEVVWITIFYTSAIKSYIHFGRGSFHSWTEHFKIVPLYSLVLSLIATFTSSRAGLVYILPLVHIIIDIALVKMKILKVNVDQSLSTISRYFLMTVISRIFYKIIYRN